MKEEFCSLNKPSKLKIVHDSQSKYTAYFFIFPFHFVFEVRMYFVLLWLVYNLTEEKYLFLLQTL